MVIKIHMEVVTEVDGIKIPAMVQEVGIAASSLLFYSSVGLKIKVLGIQRFFIH